MPLLKAAPSEADANFDLVTFLPFVMRRFVIEWTRAYEEFSIGRHKITMAEVRFLILLDPRTAVRLDLVQERAQVTAVQISRSLATATGQGLVVSSKDPQDGRRTIVRLTRRGQSVREEAISFARELENELLQGMPTTQTAALTATVIELTGRLVKRDDPPRSAGTAAVAKRVRERRRSRAL